MTRVFEDIKLEWGGVEYVIPSNRVMGAIMRIEQHVTLAELYRGIEGNSVKTGTLAAAYAALLQYAGRRETTTEEIYLGMFSDGGVERVLQATEHLLVLMIPPSANEEQNQGEGNRAQRRAAAAAQRKDAAKLSRKPTEPPAPGG